MSTETVKHPDPTAMGLFGLAMVTLVACTQKLGITQGTAYVLPWAIFLGAFVQLVAGILDFKKGNAFGGTAFLAYAFFWLAVAMSWLISLGAFGTALQSAFDVKQLGVAFVGYLIFTIYMTIGATQTNGVLFFIFLLIDFLFLGLSMSVLADAPGIKEFGHHLAAYSELAISLLSFYLSAALIFKTQFGRTMLPIGGKVWNVRIGE
ncbi:MAG TPA: acetate uptake transporter [Phnomibacter sp.]|nr:acetate uptake transporter [Phnomibacter sp.]